MTNGGFVILNFGLVLWFCQAVKIGPCYIKMLAYDFQVVTFAPESVGLPHALNVLTHLLWDWQFWEVWDVSGPLDGAEEEPGGQLTDAVDAHNGGSARRCLHLWLTVRGHVPAAGVRLGPEELGDELRDLLPIEVVRPDVTRPSSSSCQGVGTDTWVSWRDSTPLDCCRKRGRRGNTIKVSSTVWTSFIINNDI